MLFITSFFVCGKIEQNSNVQITLETGLGQNTDV